MPATVSDKASDAPIVAFFDVDNTLLRGASMYHMAKAARRAHIIKAREIIKFDPKAVIIMCSALGQESLVMEDVDTIVCVYPGEPEDALRTAPAALVAQPLIRGARPIWTTAAPWWSG